MSLFAQLVPIGGGPISYIGLDADITNSGINLFVSVDVADGSESGGNSLYNARRLSNIPSTHLFDDTPMLSLTSPLLSATHSHICIFSVYLDADNAVHSESTMLSPVNDAFMGSVYATPLLPSYWDQLVHQGSELHSLYYFRNDMLTGPPGIDRYTVIIDVLEINHGASLEDGYRKFSLAINMKMNSAEESMLSSCTPCYQLPAEYPDISSTNTYNVSYLPDMSLQMPSSFQGNHVLSTWSDNGYFIPQNSFVQYPDLGDSRFEVHPEPGSPSFPYPSL